MIRGLSVRIPWDGKNPVPLLRRSEGMYSGGEKAWDVVSWGVTLPGSQLVSQVGNGDVPGLEEDGRKGHVPLPAAESEKEISCLNKCRLSGCTFPF